MCQLCEIDSVIIKPALGRMEGAGCKTCKWKPIYITIVHNIICGLIVGGPRGAKSNKNSRDRFLAKKISTKKWPENDPKLPKMAQK